MPQTFRKYGQTKNNIGTDETYFCTNGHLHNDFQRKRLKKMQIHMSYTNNISIKAPVCKKMIENTQIGSPMERRDRVIILQLT